MLEPYLIFDGNCADAMRFYERTLGGKLEALMTFGESPVPDQVPPGAADRIMHARLVIGDRALMASDGMLGEPYEGMKNFSVTLYYPAADEAKRILGVPQLRLLRTILSIGHVDAAARQQRVRPEQPRKALADIVHHERW